MQIATILQGSAAASILGIVGAVVRGKVAAATAERTAAERERAQLIASVNQATQQTLAIVREELRVQQENTTRFFALLDRNTAALEKLVAAQAAQGGQLGAMQTQLSEMKGAMSQRTA